MSRARTLTREVLFAPVQDGSLAYFPDCGALLEVNATGRAVLERAAAGEVRPDLDNALFLSQLEAMGLLRPCAEGPAQPEPAGVPAGPACVECGAGEGAGREEALAGVDALTLFLTSRCNLACVYCYADAGRKQEDLSWPLARGALDLLLSVDRGDRPLTLGFHGGGEPLLNFEVMEQAVEYLLERREDARFAIASNGVMEDGQLEWLMRHEFDLSLSVDGPAEVQNAQRPGRGFCDSHARVQRTLGTLAREGYPFSVRATVTTRSLPHLPAFVEQLVAETCADPVQLEPLYLSGRGRRLEALRPRAEDFVEVFERCRVLASARGRQVVYSGAQYPQRREVFCKACGYSLCVTPDGSLTTCYELTDGDGGANARFRVGRWEQESGAFALQVEALLRLRTETVHALDGCRGCIARYHCAGDCPAKRSHPGDSYRCRINRELVTRRLLETLRQRGRENPGFD